MKMDLKFGNVKNKKIITPNDFVSHMIEHIAWRMGMEIDLEWHSEEWYKLGLKLGEKINENFEKKSESSVAIGSIDDGIAKVKTQSDEPILIIKSSKNVDLNFFLKNRCEQIESGQPLLDLLEGISNGLKINIEIIICNHRDSHHTWESVFRGVGICLSKIFSNKKNEINFEINTEKNCSSGDISVLERSLNHAKVRRGTAESWVEILLDLNNQEKSTVKINVKDSIKDAVNNLDKLINILAKSLKAKIDINFKATVLSSSHVVLEDIGLVLGRALLEIIKLRFEKLGANGAGSSINNIEEFEKQNGSVVVGIEGRKIWQFLPLEEDFEYLNKNFLQFQDILGNIRSEDLDDFFDGLSGGLTASIIICIKKFDNADELWQEVFKNLGTAILEALEINQSRKGVPPGVKATLS